jgi:hypothetical protein
MRQQIGDLHRCAGLLQQIAKGIRRHRRAHQESLNGIAGLGLKKLQLRLGCDALGHDFQIQAVMARTIAALSGSSMRSATNERSRW